MLGSTYPIEKITSCQIGQFLGKPSEGLSSEVWRVTLFKTKTFAFAKLCDTNKELLAEVIASLCGRALGLPIPTPHFCEVIPDTIPVDSKFASRQNVVAFVSHCAGSRSMSFARMRKNNIELINKWVNSRDLHNTVVFDEWIANGDRNLSNILWDAQSQRHWLIDHANSLFHHTEIAQLEELFATPSKNILLHHVVAQYDEDSIEQNNFIAAFQKIYDKLSLLILDELAQDEIYEYINEHDIKTVIPFLRQRITYLIMIIYKKIGVQYQDNLELH